MSWTTWDPAPLVVGGAGVVAVLFAGGFVRLRRRGRPDHAGWSRPGLFALALALGTVPLVSPLDEAGDDHLLSAHMLQHVLIGDAAPALALVALRGPLIYFLLPRTLLCRLARIGALRRALAFLLRPRVSLAAWALALSAWHVPAVYDYALAHETVHDLEHLCFIVAGLLVWAQLVDPARRNSLRERLGCMVAMGAFTLALGTVLIATPSLYPSYAHPEVRLFGLGASLDQRLAAAVMLAEQLAALGVCAWYLLRGRVVPRRVPVRPRVALTD